MSNELAGSALCPGPDGMEGDRRACGDICDSAGAARVGGYAGDDVLMLRRCAGPALLPAGRFGDGG